MRMKPLASFYKSLVEVLCKKNETELRFLVIVDVPQRN